MKYLKLFEQDFDDPFGEESYGDKFEIGDFVVILNNLYGGKLDIGGVGTIIGINTDGSFLVYQKNNNKSWWYSGQKDIRKASNGEIKNYLER